METVKSVCFFLIFTLANCQLTRGQGPLSETELLQRAQACADALVTSRFHNETQQCYPMPSTGPCGTNTKMTFSSVDYLYGSCQCTELSKLTAYYPPHNKCYSVYEQGFCKRGHILVPARAGSAELRCQKNPCFRRWARKLLIPFEGRCVELGSNCVNKGAVPENSEAKETIRIDEDDGSTLICGFAKKFSFAFSAFTTNCPRGSFKTRSQTCSRVIFNADDW